jgi:hypothetical protein
MFADSSDESEGDDAPAAAPSAPAEDNEKKRPLEEEEAAAGAALPSALDALGASAPPEFLTATANVEAPPEVAPSAPATQRVGVDADAKLEADRREHALHEKLKADTQRRLKKRRKEEREERKAQPAYERQSMHGQKIAISVGPCSLPENMRTTYSSIPRADTKWK